MVKLSKLAVTSVVLLVIGCGETRSISDISDYIIEPTDGIEEETNSDSSTETDPAGDTSIATDSDGETDNNTDSTVDEDTGNITDTTSGDTGGDTGNDSDTTSGDTGGDTGNDSDTNVDTEDDTGSGSDTDNDTDSDDDSDGDTSPQDLMLNPIADAYVDSTRGDENFGREQVLLVDTEPAVYNTILRFVVPKLTADLRSAKLRLFVTNPSPDGPKVYLTDNNWTEDGVTWNNHPSQTGPIIDDVGGVSTGWLEFDVTNAISGSGEISFLLLQDAADGADFDSREANNKPQLSIITGEPTVSEGTITHIATTEVWDADGQDMSIARPSGSTTGDLLILILHRTDDDLPLYVDGWTRVAECYKRDNGYDCSTEADCTVWHNDDFCETFGTEGQGGHDLAQSIFYRAVSSNEPNSYLFDLNRDSSGHPGWAILSALRGANTDNPVRDWSYIGCDGDADSVFPSVHGENGDMVLLSQSFDDAIAEEKFGAPTGTNTFGYVSDSDEAGFLFGGTLTSSGETGTMKTHGDGGPSCKDALVSLTIIPQ